MTNPFVTQARVLLQDWTDFCATLKVQIDIDRANGLARTAEAQECSLLAVEACIKGLRDILPPDKP